MSIDIKPIEKILTIKDGSKLAYCEYNGDPESKNIPLICIMGMNCIKEDSGPYPLMIANKGRNVITFDNRNMGNSYGDISNLSVNLMAKDTIELIQHLGYLKVDIVAFSMGGIITFDILFNHRDIGFEVNKILLCVSCCRKPDNHLTIGGDAIKDAVSYASLNLLFDENFVKEDNVVIDFLKKNFSLTRRPKETIQAQYQLLTDFDYKEQLQSRDFTKKLYIFHGKLDRVIPYQEAEYTFNTASGSTLYTNLPSLDFGHMCLAYFTPDIWVNAFVECLDE